ncbi:unnamed protein product [Bursaphelenchus okinawaensis]|uniref:protein-serine/threonine phosphatase n=1 Tax=Bursaphelenchus okinawaensis TaxID=465554 RepID=A0A811JU78_9BILA|nr:unnamed protein product [Bursaphelenchus okinawaensis]CAG9083136.1 unnamed protein product [Bursaphelenchus okinawaensis]
MPKLLIKLCCCLRPQRCKKANSDSDRQSNAQNGNSLPGATSAPPTSIITQVSKDTDTFPTPIVKKIPSPDDSNHNNNASQLQPRGQGVDNNVIVSGNRLQKPQINQSNALLPPLHPLDHKKKCLIVDLDETLVHSSFKPVKNADFVIPVEIDNVVHQVHVLKRPHTDAFLERIGELFECVLFTASLDMYADPVADLLDRKGVFKSRLFREACVFFAGNYVKDLTRLGRDVDKVIIVDNSPISYAFHPENAIAVRTWFDDPNDTELLDMLPLLEQLAHTDDIYSVLRRSFMGGTFAGNYE